MSTNESAKLFDSLVIPLISLSFIAKGLAKETMAMCNEVEKNKKGENSNGCNEKPGFTSSGIR